MSEEPLRRLRELESHLIDPELLSGVLDVLPDAVVAANENGEIVLANKQAELLFGYPKASLYGNKIEMLMPESVREKHIEHRQGFVAEPRVRPMGVGMVLTARHRSGREFSVQINLGPLVTEHGTLTIAVIRQNK